MDCLLCAEDIFRSLSELPRCTGEGEYSPLRGSAPGEDSAVASPDMFSRYSLSSESNKRVVEAPGSSVDKDTYKVVEIMSYSEGI